jgi:hypothetical protein
MKRNVEDEKIKNMANDTLIKHAEIRKIIRVGMPISKEFHDLLVTEKRIVSIEVLYILAARQILFFLR